MKLTLDNLPLGRDYDFRAGKSCTEWGAYVLGIVANAGVKNFPVELIDWSRADDAWQKYACDSAEGFMYATQEERKMQDDVFIANLKRNNYKLH